MATWSELTEDPLDVVLDNAVTSGLNAIGARAGLAPLRWSLSAISSTTYTGPADEQTAITVPHITVTGEVPDAGNKSEVAHSWAALLELTPATHGPAGQLIFVGHHEELIVRVMAVVDAEAFREHTERRLAERDRQIAEMRRTTAAGTD